MARRIMTSDVRDLLTCFAAAIELDQVRVDALPARKFHHLYSGSLWRMWRRHHSRAFLTCYVVLLVPPRPRIALRRWARRMMGW